jgi:hypothetical protein
LVRDSNVPANLRGAHEGADVEVGKLDDAETFKSSGQAPELDPLMRGFEVQSTIEKSISACNKGGSAHNLCRLLDALVCAEETEHSSSLCALKIRRDSYQEFPPPRAKRIFS